jgi:hypothetical protein
MEITLLNEMREALPELRGGLSTETLVNMNAESSIVHMFYTMLRSLMMVSIEMRIPLRGATAYGEIVSDEEKRIILGQPIIDAYELEKRQEWIGIIFHPSTARYRLGDNEPAATMWVRRHDVPMKCDKIESHLVLEWFRDENGQVNEATKQALIEMRDASNSPDANVRKKYENTLAFIEVLEKRWTKT